MKSLKKGAAVDPTLHKEVGCYPVNIITKVQLHKSPLVNDEGSPLPYIKGSPSVERKKTFGEHNSY